MQMVKTDEGFVPITDYKEFRKQYDYGDPNYSIYYKFFKRPISYPLTWLVYRYTNLRPNALSYIGFFFAILSTIFFWQGTATFFLLGAISFFIYDIFDDFDGVIARSKNIRSRRGGWLDILAGCVGKMMVLASVSIGMFKATGNEFMLLLGLIGVVGMAAVNNLDHVTKIRFSVVVQKKLKFIETKPDSKTLAGKLSILSEILLNAWFILLILAGLFDYLEIFLLYSAGYYAIYPILLFFYLNRKYKDA